MNQHNLKNLDYSRLLVIENQKICCLISPEYLYIDWFRLEQIKLFYIDKNTFSKYPLVELIKPLNYISRYQQQRRTTKLTGYEWNNQ